MLVRGAGASGIFRDGTNGAGASGIFRDGTNGRGRWCWCRWCWFTMGRWGNGGQMGSGAMALNLGAVIEGHASDGLVRADGAVGNYFT